MATCPNCGEIIMEGDSYCSHCGAHLQWNERDNSSKPKNDRFSLDEILNQMSLFGRKREILKDKVKEFLSNRYCRNLKVRSYYNMYVFEFTRENRYVKTIDEFYYNPDYDNPKRVFEDSITRHYHDNLLKYSGFKNLVRLTGKELVGCFGGFETELSWAGDTFIFSDEVRVWIQLRGNDSETVSYDLDLENMRLK